MNSNRTDPLSPPLRAQSGLVLNRVDLDMPISICWRVETGSANIPKELGHFEAYSASFGDCGPRLGRTESDSIPLQLKSVATQSARV